MWDYFFAAVAIVVLLILFCTIMFRNRRKFTGEFEKYNDMSVSEIVDGISARLKEVSR